MGEPDPAAEVAANLEAVMARIRGAAQRSGRDASAVRLVAVTKAQPPDRVRAAYRAGVCDFGENRVEEALAKLVEFSQMQGVRWHMIGHIQSRKARLVAPAFEMVHSVDRLKIAGLLDRHAGEAGRRLPVLLECNVSGEATKEGWASWDKGAWQALAGQARQVLELPHLEVLGLMTMAPWTAEPDTVRPVFRRLRALRDFLAERVPGRWDELSMGMSDDFEVAVEEGATLVRIGRAIFGPRVQVALVK
jgi:hypothetical protein